MALYDINKTRSFFSELGQHQDTCTYCEKLIREEAIKTKEDKDITFKKLKDLQGKLSGKRIAKITKYGNVICICEKCLINVIKEVNPDSVVDVANKKEAIELPDAQNTKLEKKAGKKGGKDDKKEQDS